jgi:single-strand DNA-binding protein
VSGGACAHLDENLDHMKPQKGGKRMLNQVVLTGNLGADPEVFYSSEGDPVASFNLAFRSSEKKTRWIKVVCFHRLAEVTEKHLHKGARIGIIGTLDQNRWENEEGITRSNFQLIANSLEFIKTAGRGFEENRQADDEVPF